MLRIKKGVPYPENIIQEIFHNPDIEITEDMKDGFYHALGSLNDYSRMCYTCAMLNRRL